MVRAGASALELGFPFSDPVADGPVIQRAAHEVLQTGFSIDNAFTVIERAREFGPSTPIGVLVYYNIVLAQGVEKFFSRCRFSGVDGVLIADLPVESIREVSDAAEKSNVRLILLVSPVTSPSRIEAICKNAGGFIYPISRLGVTGTGERDGTKDEPLSKLIAALKAQTKVPVCAGFGISNPKQAREMLALGVDGVITGSRVIELIRSAPPAEATGLLAEFCRSMVKECTEFGAPCVHG